MQLLSDRQTLSSWTIGNKKKPLPKLARVNMLIKKQPAPPSLNSEYNSRSAFKVSRPRDILFFNSQHDTRVNHQTKKTSKTIPKLTKTQPMI